MKKDYTREVLNKIINYPCNNIKAYSNTLHKFIDISFSNYDELKRQCLSYDLAINQTGFRDEQLNLKIKNCFHIWVSNYQLECSY